MATLTASAKIEERPAWRQWVTPGLTRQAPIHRWFVFPHSFTPDLVQALAHEWKLDQGCRILDPFVGAGTTLVAAKSLGIPAIGYDLSPLAVFTTNVKVADYNHQKVVENWRKLSKRLRARPGELREEFPELVEKAFPGLALDTLAHIRREIDRVEDSKIRAFFLLALLSILQNFSKAIPNGGWLRWSAKRVPWSQILPAFRTRVEVMVSDLRELKAGRRKVVCKAFLADARELPESGQLFDGLITSPPYPNRHDYTRIFNVELLFAFLDKEGVRRLRYQSFESHVEAKPQRNNGVAYRQPKVLKQILAKLKSKHHDERIPPMLEGYFEDCYLNLVSSSLLMKTGAKMAYVVGNSSYSGIPICVDEILCDIGWQAGLVAERIVASRYRGNSAQQMGKYGRNPSRESVVLFRRP